jgi:hypothetical protein
VQGGGGAVQGEGWLLVEVIPGGAQLDVDIRRGASASSVASSVARRRNNSVLAVANQRPMSSGVDAIRSTRATPWKSRDRWGAHAARGLPS